LVGFGHNRHDMTEPETQPEPRRALVLGAGGVIGFAWILGALYALQETTGIDPAAAEVVVGTSAGSVAATLLSCVLPVDAICRHHQGIAGPEDPSIDFDYGGRRAALPPLPRLLPASPRLALGGLRYRRRVSPLMALTGMLPNGRGTLAPLRELIDAIAADAGIGDGWPTTPRPWIVTADYRTGRRIVFGRDPGAVAGNGSGRSERRATLSDAVVASCSIPAWYPPTVIDGVPYIDGGTVSNTSADLVLGSGVHEVYVLAPMASVQAGRSRGAFGHAERWARRWVTRSVLADVDALRTDGKRVCLLTPGPADLAVMGANLMNPARRTAVLESAARTAAGQLAGQRAAFPSWPDHAVTTTEGDRRSS
jgi:NTE family protein